MEIIELKSNNEASSKLFAEVATRVYQDDAVWASASETVFVNNLLQQQDRPGDLFLPVIAMENAQPVARAVAILKQSAVGEDGGKQGYIGFFECVESRPAAAHLVLSHCEQVLKLAGAKSVQAPKVDNQLFGCQISDFDLPHVCLTQHNPPYYLNFFESAGYTIKQHIFSMYFTRETVNEPITLDLPDFTTRVFDRLQLDREIEIIHRLQPEIFSDRPGYVPRTLSDDRNMIQSMLSIIDDDLIIFAENEKGETVGTLVCLPDYYQALAGDKIDRARIISIGILPEYVDRGLGTLMGLHLMKNLIGKRQYKFAEGSLVLAHNIAPQNLAKRFRANPGRRFVVLEKNI